MTRSLIAVRDPRPRGTGSVDHDLFREPLYRLQNQGSSAIADLDGGLRRYLDSLAGVDPDRLTREEALAYWINLYNAGALILAGEAQMRGEDSVLRVPGGFRRPFVELAGEHLSLDNIEHAKLRRFGDPRIHTALICGSVSCPTLRAEPYLGSDLFGQLDDQTRHFLSVGGCIADTRREVVSLSRVFYWYGADFVRPHRMPTFLPASRSSVLAALIPWLEPDTADWIEATAPNVEYQSYNWGLRCAVG